MANLMGRILGAACAIAMPLTAVAGEAGPLQPQAKIPLGNVKGRIDHLAVDLARQRLFVAELGNNSLGVVDLKTRKFARRITGLREPQGVGYVVSTDTIYVANAGDGSVRLFRGDALEHNARRSAVSRRLAAQAGWPERTAGGQFSDVSRLC